MPKTYEGSHQQYNDEHCRKHYAKDYDIVGDGVFDNTRLSTQVSAITKEKDGHSENHSFIRSMFRESVGPDAGCLRLTILPWVATDERMYVVAATRGRNMWFSMSPARDLI